MARAMVTKFGYSDKLGTVAYGENNDEVFLGMSMGRQQSISESTAQTIDAEVKILVDKGYSDARHILTEHNEEFCRLAEALLEYETLTGEECKAAMRGEKIIRKDDDGNSSAGSAVPSAGRPRPRGDTPGGLEPQPTT
jgi:cell division protease FtsH